MAGANGITADAVAGKLHRHGAGQRDHTALGGAVDRTAAQHSLVVVRADVDNIATLALVHLPGD